MKAVAVPLLIAIVVAGSIYTLAADDADARGVKSNLSDKYVILDIRGRNRLGLIENVRFDSIGERDFVVVPLKHKSSQLPFEYWAPVTDITSMMVFDSRDDAVDYDTMATIRQRAALSNLDGPEIENDEP